MDWWKTAARWDKKDLRPGMGVQIWKKLIMGVDIWYCTWCRHANHYSFCLIITHLSTWNFNFCLIQCKPDISRLVGSMERYRDISGSVIYRATAMSQNPGQIFQRVVSGDGAFVCLAANSARRQRIPWHLSKFDVALQNRVVEFQTKAVCA